MVVNLAKGSNALNQAANDAIALRRVFETIHHDSCPTTYNFHMHTVCSDGRLQPEDVLGQAIAIGLRGFAITDHHATEGYERAKHRLDEYKQEATRRGVSLPIPTIWAGIEITSKLLDTEVHILGYAFNLKSSFMQPYVQHHSPKGADAAAEQVIHSIHQAGGLAVLAHPARYKRSAEDVIMEAVRLGIDGVETYYAYGNPTPWSPSPRQTETVQRLSSTYGLLNTCGTDTHGLSLLQRL